MAKTLNDELDKLQKELKDFNHDKEKNLSMEEIGKKIESFKNNISMFHTELGNPQNGLSSTCLRQYRRDYRDHKKFLSNVQQKFKDENQSSEKDQDNMDETSQFIQGALDTQAQSKDSLRRSAAKIAETVVISRQVAGKLDEQTAQIKGFDEDLRSIELTLKRAKKTIKRMARGVATDKMMWVVSFLVFAVVVSIIVYRAVYPEEQSAAASEPRDNLH